MDRILNRLSEHANASERTPVNTAPVSIREKLRRIAPETAIKLISTLLMVSALLGAEFYLHRKHGINFRGYRGPTVGQKQPGEKRIVVMGGSNAWGFGLKAGQDFPGQLQQRFAERSQTLGGPPIQTLNLAYNSEGAYAFKYTLQDYDYLNYDVVLIYSGYDDLWHRNYFVSRHRSTVFLWTGYLPLLPSLTMDKLGYWGNRLTKGYKPDVPTPPSASSRKTDEQTSGSSPKQMGSLTDSAQSNAGPTDGTCPAEWQFYCQQIYETTELALRRGKRVLVVTEPYFSDKHVQQQRALQGMLNKRFEGQANLRYLNLGRAVDLGDRSLSWDGMHLTVEGNRRIADALIQPVLELMQR